MEIMYCPVCDMEAVQNSVGCCVCGASHKMQTDRIKNQIQMVAKARVENNP